jgi:hypothetical protein
MAQKKERSPTSNVRPHTDLSDDELLATWWIDVADAMEIKTFSGRYAGSVEGGQVARGGFRYSLPAIYNRLLALRAFG